MINVLIILAGEAEMGNIYVIIELRIINYNFNYE